MSVDKFIQGGSYGDDDLTPDMIATQRVGEHLQEIIALHGPDLINCNPAGGTITLALEVNQDRQLVLRMVVTVVSKGKQSPELERTIRSGANRRLVLPDNVLNGIGETLFKGSPLVWIHRELSETDQESPIIVFAGKQFPGNAIYQYTISMKFGCRLMPEDPGAPLEF